MPKPPHQHHPVPSIHPSPRSRLLSVPELPQTCVHFYGFVSIISVNILNCKCCLVTTIAYGFGQCFFTMHTNILWLLYMNIFNDVEKKNQQKKLWIFLLFCQVGVGCGFFWFHFFVFFLSVRLLRLAVTAPEGACNCPAPLLELKSQTHRINSCKPSQCAHSSASHRPQGMGTPLGANPRLGWGRAEPCGAPHPCRDPPPQP